MSTGNSKDDKYDGDTGDTGDRVTPCSVKTSHTRGSAQPYGASCQAINGRQAMDEHAVMMSFMITPRSDSVQNLGVKGAPVIRMSGVISRGVLI